MQYLSDGSSSDDDILNFTPFSAPSVGTPDNNDKDIKDLKSSTKDNNAIMSNTTKSTTNQTVNQENRKISSSVRLATIRSPIKSIEQHLRWYKYGKVYHPVRTCDPEEANGLNLSQDGDSYDQTKKTLVQYIGVPMGDYGLANNNSLLPISKRGEHKAPWCPVKVRVRARTRTTRRR